jgi:LemA protein
MGWIFLLALVLGAAAVVAYFVTLYNALVALDKGTGRAWSNIDVLLKQRHDELPKLVATVEGYMDHERDTLERVIRARTAVASARGPREAGAANGELESALHKLFALAEGYPQLKADQSFAHLEQRISSLEEQIADRREFYNHAVNEWNVRIEQLPDLFIARLLAAAPREYFRAAEEDRKDVEIRFRRG